MATTNKIDVFEGNTLTVTCTVSGLSSLNGYTAIMTVKDDNENTKFESTGTINGLVITFKITDSQNTITPDNYKYEITVEQDSSGGNVFTVVQDIYLVKSSIVY